MEYEYLETPVLLEFARGNRKQILIEDILLRLYPENFKINHYGPLCWTTNPIRCWIR